MHKFLKLPAVIIAPFLGFIFLVPLIVLELTNRWKFDEGFPFAVFTFTWVLQTVFIFMLIPIVGSVRSGKFKSENPAILLLQIAVLALIVYIWAGWIIDQLPCLMGVPHCD